MVLVPPAEEACPSRSQVIRGPEPLTPTPTRTASTTEVGSGVPFVPVRTTRLLALAASLALAPLGSVGAEEPAPTGGDGDFICSTYDTAATTCEFVADFKSFSTPSDYMGEITVYDETEQRLILWKRSPQRGIHTYNFVGASTVVGHRYTAALTGEGWFSIVEGYPPAV